MAAGTAWGSVLVAGETMAKPAELAIGISLRATAASNGPIIPSRVASDRKRLTFDAPRSGSGLPPAASSRASSATRKPSSVGWVWTKKRMPFSAGVAARLSRPESGRSTPIRSTLPAGAGDEDVQVAATTKRHAHIAPVNLVLRILSIPFRALTRHGSTPD